MVSHWLRTAKRTVSSSITPLQSLSPFSELFTRTTSNCKTNMLLTGGKWLKVSAPTSMSSDSTHLMSQCHPGMIHLTWSELLSQEPLISMISPLFMREFMLTIKLLMLRTSCSLSQDNSQMRFQASCSTLDSSLHQEDRLDHQPMSWMTTPTAVNWTHLSAPRLESQDQRLHRNALNGTHKELPREIKMPRSLVSHSSSLNLVPAWTLTTVQERLTKLPMSVTMLLPPGPIGNSSLSMTSLLQLGIDLRDFTTRTELWRSPKWNLCSVPMWRNLRANLSSSHSSLTLPLQQLLSPQVLFPPPSPSTPLSMLLQWSMPSKTQHPRSTGTLMATP